MTRFASLFIAPFAALSLLTGAALAQDAFDPTAEDAVVEYGGPDPLTIETSEGPVEFTVEVAETEEARARGMMHRDEVGEFEGMLFDFEVERPVSIWMENTRIPLDVIYVRSDGTIAKITENAQPYSRRSLPSDFAVLAVLEIGGGRSSDLSIQPGDSVQHPLFGTAQDAAPEAGTGEDEVEADEDAPADDAEAATDAEDEPGQEG
ncbi:DUF192 domain-containing protein [Glycocaulis profundi]|nr:DUF192 domain-containing protein [Glycocaulis profundi]